MTDVKGEIKVSKTLSLPVDVWELLEQIRTKKGLKNGSQAMAYAISESAEKLNNQISN